MCKEYVVLCSCHGIPGLQCILRNILKNTQKCCLKPAFVNLKIVQRFLYDSISEFDNCLCPVCYVFVPKIGSSDVHTCDNIQMDMTVEEEDSICTVYTKCVYWQ